VYAWRDPRPADDHDDRVSDLAFRGAVFGCVAVGLVSGCMGDWPLFFAFPGFALHLILSAVLGAMLAVALCRWRLRPRTAPVLVIAAALTFVIFSVLPLYLFFQRSCPAAKLLFRRTT